MVEQRVNDLLSKMIQHISSYEQLVLIEGNLGCVDGTIIGTGQADYTQGSTVYDLNVGNKAFALIDIPGIEGDESKFEDVIREALDKAHTIFYVNGSGKKIEQATLEKVKKYMHDGTSVYAIFNVHCKAKKERIPGIDKTFNEELSAAYQRHEEIINQTENELRAFLGRNYKGSLSLNGLLSFCGYAVEKSGKTTIVDEKNKNLRSDQKKYIKEYDGDVEKIREDSRIGLVQEIINDKVSHFEENIYLENIKKLNNRLQEMILKIDSLKSVEIRKIKGFIECYDDFESNCYNAKEDYIQTISHIGYSAASDAFANIKETLFGMIEDSEGKISAKEIQEYFDSNKDRIIKEIQDSLNKQMIQAQNDYVASVEDARQRLIKDFEREQTKFEISLSLGTIELDGSFEQALKYNWKLFGGDILGVGSLVLSFAGIGSLIAPGVGTAIGAAAGAILGVLSSIWKFFASKTTRINNAKEKLNRTIDEQIDKVSDNIKDELQNLNFEIKINASYDQIYNQAEKQKSSLLFVERVLNNISRELKRNYKDVAWEEEQYV